MRSAYLCRPLSKTNSLHNSLTVDGQSKQGNDFYTLCLFPMFHRCGDCLITFTGALNIHFAFVPNHADSRPALAFKVFPSTAERHIKQAPMSLKRAFTKTGFTPDGRDKAGKFGNSRINEISIGK